MKMNNIYGKLKNIKSTKLKLDFGYILMARMLLNGILKGHWVLKARLLRLRKFGVFSYTSHKNVFKLKKVKKTSSLGIV